MMTTASQTRSKSEMGPGRVETFFVPQQLQVTGRDGRRRDWLSLFLLYRVLSQSGRSLGRPEPTRHAQHDTSSSPHRGQEWFNTDDVHHSREVVGEHVQRHLGRHLRQRLH